MGERELGQQIQGGRGVFHKKQNRPCPRVFASSTLKTRVARHSAELAQMDHCNHRRTSEKQQRESSKKATTIFPRCSPIRFLKLHPHVPPILAILFCTSAISPLVRGRIRVSDFSFSNFFLLFFFCFETEIDRGWSDVRLDRCHENL